MSALVKGIHHITLCPGPAQEDVNFCTGVLGQRLVKQNVLLDGSIPIYHFYYGNRDADVGSIATSFPYSRKQGRQGSGQVSAMGYSVPAGTIQFWMEHFARHGVEHSGVQERFAEKFILARHPAGLLFEIVEAGDARRPWTTNEISEDVATRGFFGAVMSVRDVEEQERFLVEAMGFLKIGVDGPYHRFEAPVCAPGRVIDLHHEPDRAPGSWGFGAGIFHHIAFEVDDDDALLAQKALYEELGYTDASDVKDRYYFHSMYVRSPGGILVECTASAQGGFYRDESPEDLGTRLNLPPWYESQRAEILSMLEPVVLPDANRPRRDERPVPELVPVAAAAGSAVVPSRTNADFARHRR